MVKNDTVEGQHTLLVIFGISGDLATRKLLPALAHIAVAGELNNVHILGISRRNMSLPKLFMASLPENIPSSSKDKLKLATDMLQMDLSKHDEYKRLTKYITDLKLKLGDKKLQIIYYLSVPPSASMPIIKTLGDNGLCRGDVKLLLEKPFGFDYESAEDSINRINEHFSEDQVYRIDHYLAKEMAQNILVFRATNALFSDIWNNKFIDSISINAIEKIDIEGRINFYEQTGALRDILQSHLMQLLAVTLMETPNTLDWTVLPKLRALALEQVEPVTPESSQVVRGQYDTYRKEVNNPTSQTETFASVTLFSSDPIWQGVPIRLTTGKALNQKNTEIIIKLKQRHDQQSNTLRLCIQPNEGVSIDLLAKRPGYDKLFEDVTLSFSYPKGTNLPDAYEQVIIDAIRSDKSLFASSNEVMQSWRILAPVQKYWGLHSNDIQFYKKGSSAQDIIRSAKS